MSKTIRLALGIFVVGGILAIAFGTFVPVGSHSTPYVSALSNAAVSTAQAVPCNNKACNANVCDARDFYGCGIQGSKCVSGPCFP